MFLIREYIWPGLVLEGLTLSAKRSKCNCCSAWLNPPMAKQVSYCGGWTPSPTPPGCRAVVAAGGGVIPPQPQQPWAVPQGSFCCAGGLDPHLPVLAAAPRGSSPQGLKIGNAAAAVGLTLLRQKVRSMLVHKLLLVRCLLAVGSLCFLCWFYLCDSAVHTVLVIGIC